MGCLFVCASQNLKHYAHFDISWHNTILSGIPNLWEFNSHTNIAEISKNFTNREKLVQGIHILWTRPWSTESPRDSCKKCIFNDKVLTVPRINLLCSYNGSLPAHQGIELLASQLQQVHYELLVKMFMLYCGPLCIMLGKCRAYAVRRRAIKLVLPAECTHDLFPFLVLK